MRQSPSLSLQRPLCTPSVARGAAGAEPPLLSCSGGIHPLLCASLNACWGGQTNGRAGPAWFCTSSRLGDLKFGTQATTSEWPSPRRCSAFHQAAPGASCASAGHTALLFLDASDVLKGRALRRSVLPSVFHLSVRALLYSD